MKNRWISLIAGMLIQVILGGIYAWSTLITQLGESYGITKGQGGFIFGLCIATFTITMVFAGRFLVIHGPQITSMIGAFLFASGYIIASFSNGSYLILLVGLGLITGSGIGFGYVCPLSVGMKWFPHNKGLVTGISVAGFGSGAILLSAVARYFFSSGIEILLFFRWWGIISGSILFIASLFLTEPRAGQRVKKKRAGFYEIFSIQFIICVIGIFAGTFLGLFINGNLISIVIQSGMSYQNSHVAIPLFAFGNAFGRIYWGYVFDHIGYKSIPISLFGSLAISILLLLQVPGWFLLTLIGGIGFFFGANFVIYASSIARYFGQTLFSSLYPICFVAYGLAGFISPGIGGYFMDATNSFHVSLIVAMSIVLIAGIFSTLKLSLFKK